MQHGQIYFSITATLKSRIRGSMAMGSKSLCQQKRDAARTDIPQNWDVSKNVTQHGQIYPKTGPSAKTWRSTDRHTPKLGRQQKCDASRTDIAQNRAAGRLQKQSRQQKHERREGRVQKTEQNFRVFRWRVLKTFLFLFKGWVFYMLFNPWSQKIYWKKNMRLCFKVLKTYHIIKIHCTGMLIQYKISRKLHTK